MEKRTATVTISACLVTFIFILWLSSFVPEREDFVAGPMDESPAEALESLNLRNSRVRRVSCDVVMGLVSKGSLFYDKAGRMLFTVWVAGRREAVVGCDGDMYWFWIGSFDKNSLYFCGRDELDGTPLRPVMRPEVIASMSWVGTIDPEVPVARTVRGFVAEFREGGMRKVVEFDSEKIMSQSLFRGDARVVTMEGENFEEFGGSILPVLVRVVWHEEGLSGVFKVRGWKVNEADQQVSEPEGLRRNHMKSLGSVSLSK